LLAVGVAHDKAGFQNISGGASRESRNGITADRLLCRGCSSKIFLTDQQHWRFSNSGDDEVKNITVTVDDETYRRAHIKAAERDTSVSALVARFLTELAAGETDTERLKREEQALRERIGRFRAADRLPREDLHMRDL
jgi:hypothetical protein